MGNNGEHELGQLTMTMMGQGGKQREGHNTYDDKTAGFYLNVQAQFQKIATESGDRFISINANRSEEVLHQKIVSALKKRKI